MPVSAQVDIAGKHFVYAWFHCLLTLCLTLGNAYAQQYTYVHYEPKDGLAGSTVHGIAQDKDGFIWFATETGLSRFDGVHFKNFTRADGLPSNEIFALFSDSKNRLWISSFKNAICYYYNGKIYNQQNDSLLQQISLTSITQTVGENARGDVLIESSNKSFIVTASNKVLEVHHKMPELFLGTNGMQVGGKLFLRHISNPLISEAYSLYMKQGDTLLDERSSSYIFVNKDSAYIHISPGAIPYFLKLPQGTRGINRINDSTISVTFFNYGGTLLYNIYTRQFIAHHLPNHTVHSALKDMEGNIWFSTRGLGVYKMCNPTFKNCFFDSDKNTMGVSSVHKLGDFIYVGTENAQHWRLESFSPHHYTGETWYRPVEAFVDPANVATQLQYPFVHYSSSDFFRLERPGRHRKKIQASIKTLFFKGDTLIVGSGSGAFIYHIPGMNELKQLYKDRTTCAYQKDGVYYIGTLNGLYQVSDPGKTPVYMGYADPLFKNRISGFAEDSYGILWIATYEHGIIGYRNGTVVVNITQRDNGLSSDICRCLFISGNYLWAGTEKGLNKIDISPGTYAVTSTFTAADGLSSDIINTVLVDGTMVYAGTPRGLTYFDEAEVLRNTAFCHLKLTGISISGKQQPYTEGPLVLPHDHNNIQFEYAGISFLSGGDITYMYRLLGPGNQWQTTRENVLNYPSLPSGKYVLQLIAINKFHDQSPMLEQYFEIEQVLWEKMWFRICMILALTATIWLMIQVQIRKVRKKEKEKRNIAQKIAELELEAIKAQINPHFIYNCLNSIQYFNYKRQHESSQEYLDLFASLIRKTMEYSRKTFITLEEETEYLTNYLRLEKLRFKDKLHYAIEVHAGAFSHRMIPAMLIQPYVENALKHAIPGTDHGKVTITFMEHNSHVLKITIEDNGPGLIKPPNTDKRPQMGMWLSGSRANVYNQLFGSDIQINFLNKKDIDPDTRGTLIEILIPHQITNYAPVQDNYR